MSIKSQLKKIDVNKIKLDNGKTVKQAMIEEAKLLENLLKKHLRSDVFINPSYYAFGQESRTGMLEDSLYVDTNVRISGNRFEIDVVFGEDSNRASGYGIWNNNPHEGENDYSLSELFEEGYAVSKPVWFKDIPNFGYRKGSHFIKNAIEEFNRTNSLGMYVDYDTDVHWNYR